MMGVRIGEEGDEGEVGGDPVFMKVECEGDGRGEQERRRFEFAELADYGGVMKGVPGIFAAGDVGVEIFFGDGDPQFD